MSRSISKHLQLRAKSLLVGRVKDTGSDAPHVVTCACIRNVGLFRYWEVKQIPNFLLASPTLLYSFYCLYHYVFPGKQDRLLHAVSRVPPTHRGDRALHERFIVSLGMTTCLPPRHPGLIGYTPRSRVSYDETCGASRLLAPQSSSLSIHGSMGGDTGHGRVLDACSDCSSFHHIFTASVLVHGGAL